MTTRDCFEKAEGHVVGRFVGPDGRSTPVCDTHNATMYASADVVARAYAGDMSGIPSKIAFLYGSTSSPATAVPSARNTSWADVASSFSYVETPFSYAPTVTVSDADADTGYSSNRVVFHGRTQGIDDAGDVYVYAACLVGADSGGSPRLLAVVDLGTGTPKTYRKKPDDFELSIDWAVTFK